MPEGKTNPYTHRQKLLEDALRYRIDLLKKVLAVPLGMAEVSGEEYKRRYDAMTPEQRLAEIERLGLDEVERLLLGEQGEGE